MRKQWFKCTVALAVMLAGTAHAAESGGFGESVVLSAMRFGLLGGTLHPSGKFYLRHSVQFWCKKSESQFLDMSKLLEAAAAQETSNGAPGTNNALGLLSAGAVWTAPESIQIENASFKVSPTEITVSKSGNTRHTATGLSIFIECTAVVRNDAPLGPGVISVTFPEIEALKGAASSVQCVLLSEDGKAFESRIDIPFTVLSNGQFMGRLLWETLGMALMIAVLACILLYIFAWRTGVVRFFYQKHKARKPNRLFDDPKYQEALELLSNRPARDGIESAMNAAVMHLVYKGVPEKTARGNLVTLIQIIHRANLADRATCARRGSIIRRP